MITATYFGEITELDSRAVWYSDEEDDDEDDGTDTSIKSIPKTIEPISHETFRSSVQVNFTKIIQELEFKISTCIISLSSSTQFKNHKLSSINSLPLVGFFEDYGKAFLFPAPIKTNDKPEKVEHIIWLLFDSSHHYIRGQEVSYFVEKLHEQLQSEFNIGSNIGSQVIILSQQFSSSEHLEYLSNFSSNNLTTLLRNALPFIGNSMLPPTIIKSQFESSLFEQLTLSLKPAQLVCLPSPKNFWFDRTKNWPTIPEEIIVNKLNDDHLEKTLIFT